jgi:hypothetical protein
VDREQRTLQDAGSERGLSYATARRQHQRALERLARQLVQLGVTGTPEIPAEG